jgi:hypothetical protein
MGDEGGRLAPRQGAASARMPNETVIEKASDLNYQ